MQLQRHVLPPASLRHALVPPAVALLAIVGIATGVRILHGRHGLTRADIAALAVKDFALDAFPRWRGDHPGRSCPPSIDELTPYLDTRDTRDPWGQPYRFACEPGSLWVISSGEDGRIGTDDDIRSDR